MPTLTVSNVSIKGISACVPPKVEENLSLPIYSSKEEAEKVIATTGVERRHLVSDGITASDLCLQSANKLLHDLCWEKKSIDAVCFVTQTPDYINHPNSFIIHNKLNLKEDCLCLDLYHGCPGWIMGLQTLSSLLSQAGGGIKRALLLVGDNVTLNSVPYYDREKRPLHGDCGTAAALEYNSQAPDVFFDTGTRSEDGKSLIIPEGGSRHPFTLEEYKDYLDLLKGNTKPSDSDMDGMSVFSFGISVPPKSIRRLCDVNDIDLSKVDKVILHQANAFMLKKIIKKLKVVDSSKVPMSLKNYGNTTSASIPLTIVSECGNDYSSKKLKTICSAFGTGLSWATCYFETDSICCPNVIVYNKEKADDKL